MLRVAEAWASASPDYEGRACAIDVVNLDLVDSTTGRQRQLWPWSASVGGRDLPACSQRQHHLLKPKTCLRTAVPNGRSAWLSSWRNYSGNVRPTTFRLRHSPSSRRLATALVTTLGSLRRSDFSMVCSNYADIPALAHGGDRDPRRAHRPWRAGRVYIRSSAKRYGRSLWKACNLGTTPSRLDRRLWDSEFSKSVVAVGSVPADRLLVGAPHKAVLGNDDIGTARSLALVSGWRPPMTRSSMACQASTAVGSAKLKSSSGMGGLCALPRTPMAAYPESVNL